MTDEYIKNLYLVIEMCDLTISNRLLFNPDLVRKAEKIKHETEEQIRLHQLNKE